MDVKSPSYMAFRLDVPALLVVAPGSSVFSSVVVLRQFLIPSFTGVHMPSRFSSHGSGEPPAFIHTQNELVSTYLRGFLFRSCLVYLDAVGPLCNLCLSSVLSLSELELLPDTEQDHLPPSYGVFDTS